MKNPGLPAVLLIAASLTFTACGGGGGGGGGNNGGGGDGLFAGDNETFTADGVSFAMVYVPAGLTFPTGIDDDGTATVAGAYWIGETEVTYELWKKVYDWATTDAGSGKRADGGDLYYFANAGWPGDDGSRGVQHPVTMVNWRDSMVWCNALTEWYNAYKGTSYECVYTHSSAIIRDSRDSNATACDGAVASSTAKGFRLLASNEWELAARYRGTDTANIVAGTIDGIDFSAMGEKWTKGNSASGATAYYLNADATRLVAWYVNNSNNSTHAVKGKSANTLGLYDMSGNVFEWCFDKLIGSPLHLGGSYFSAIQYLRVSERTASSPDSVYYFMGFRLARTAL